MSTDVFPRRNLPDEAEEWGRKVEERIVALEGVGQVLGGKAQGVNRTQASSLQDLAQQLARLDALRKSIPRSAAITTSNYNFGLPSADWHTIAETTLTGTGTGGSVTAVSSGTLISGPADSLIGTRFRLVLNNVNPSPEFPGMYTPQGAFYVPIIPSFSWNFTGTSANVKLQCAPESAQPWPSGTGSHVALALYGSFYG